ncbi:MAG: hypothetical protein ACI4C4_04600 [Lachnospiraceae bacterium]
MEEKIEQYALEDEKLKDVTGGIAYDEIYDETPGAQFQCFVCKAIFPATPGNANCCPICHSKFVDPYNE